MSVVLPGYQFACHEQITKELSRHNASAIDWLKNRMNDGTMGISRDGDLLTRGELVTVGLFSAANAGIPGESTMVKAIITLGMDNFGHHNQKNKKI